MNTTKTLLRLTAFLVIISTTFMHAAGTGVRRKTSISKTVIAMMQSQAPITLLNRTENSLRISYENLLSKTIFRDVPAKHSVSLPYDASLGITIYYHNGTRQKYLLKPGATRCFDITPCPSDKKTEDKYRC